MALENDFARDAVFPSWFANRVQDFVSALKPELILAPMTPDPVTAHILGITVSPAGPAALAAVNIAGRWRFNTVPVNRAHPGGAAGNYSIWAVAADNDIDNTPQPHTDHTVYTFDVRITDGSDPTGFDIFEEIGTLHWTGASIDNLLMLVGQVNPSQLPDGTIASLGSDVQQVGRFLGGIVLGIKDDVVDRDKIGTTIQTVHRAVADIPASNVVTISGSAHDWPEGFDDVNYRTFVSVTCVNGFVVAKITAGKSPGNAGSIQLFNIMNVAATGVSIDLLGIKDS